ncbi:unnamed protein product [Paramecium octaurelia]|uniref:Uncharacterized protein n=1 Tax=Paramecium octaurelia TaxID=43137 RepID=A0A8S1THT3_PAROT|nr:unnamed protein product [Paramecium octaurelia]
MNNLKSLGIVKKQKDDSYRCNYCQFECDSQLKMIHHNSSCFFSEYDKMKKRTGFSRSQLKEQDKKQKRAIRNILNSKIQQNSLDAQTQNKTENGSKEEEQSKSNKLQNEIQHNPEFVSDDKNELVDSTQDDQFIIKGEENNIILSMLALQNRSELRLKWDWPQHERFTKQLGMQSLKETEITSEFKSTLEYNALEGSEEICELTSNKQCHPLKQNDILLSSHQEVCQKDSNLISIDLRKNEEQMQNPIQDLGMSVVQNDDNIQAQESSPHNLQKQELKQELMAESIKEKSVLIKNQDLNNQKNYSLENQDIKSEIIIKGPSKQESNIESDDEDINFLDPTRANNQFNLILQQAHFELIHRNQLKEVHKVLRDYYDQVRLDVFDIEKVWGLVQSQHSQAILNYRQLLKCLLDLHDQEKIQLDEHKQILYLI